MQGWWWCWFIKYIYKGYNEGYDHDIDGVFMKILMIIRNWVLQYFKQNNYILVSTCVSLWNAQCEVQYTHFFLIFWGNFVSKIFRVSMRNTQYELQYTQRWNKACWIFFSITYSAWVDRCQSLPKRLCFQQCLNYETILLSIQDSVY